MDDKGREMIESIVSFGHFFNRYIDLFEEDDDGNDIGLTREKREAANYHMFMFLQAHEENIATMLGGICAFFLSILNNTSLTYEEIELLSNQEIEYYSSLLV